MLLNLGFAISPVMTEIVTDYLGAVPRMDCLGIYISPATNTMISSQCFHRDEHDFRQVDIFVNLDDVTAEEGPLTFLPAPETAAVCRAVGKGWRGKLRECLRSRVGGVWPSDRRRSVGKYGTGKGGAPDRLGG